MLYWMGFLGMVLLYRNKMEVWSKYFLQPEFSHALQEVRPRGQDSGHRSIYRTCTSFAVILHFRSGGPARLL
jgi:hypothetical protein